MLCLLSSASSPTSKFSPKLFIPSSPSCITWRAPTAHMNFYLRSKIAAAEFSAMADFPLQLLIHELGIWKCTGMGKWRNRECGFNNNWGSDKGSGRGAKGARLFWLSLEKITWELWLPDEVKLAPGSDMQGTHLSSQHWNLCSPVSVSGSQNSIIQFCFEISSSFFYCSSSHNERQPAASAISTTATIRYLEFLCQLWSLLIHTDLHMKTHQKACCPSPTLLPTIWSFFSLFLKSDNYQEECLNYWNVENPNHIFVQLTV